jgi:hypothetical protein
MRKEPFLSPQFAILAVVLAALYIYMRDVYNRAKHNEEFWS